MTVKSVTSYLHNGKQNGVGQAGETHSSGFWRKIQINEWTFSLFLFALSMAIVAGKLFINYGHVARSSANVSDKVFAFPAFSQVNHAFAISQSQQSSGFEDEKLRAVGYKLTNVSREYGDATAGAVDGISHRFGWLIRAASCGLAMMGFTWFIIYKDSCIPGVNPPLPFSPSKQRYPEKSRLQINYLVGALNGILIFVYMCL